MYLNFQYVPRRKHVLSRLQNKPIVNGTLKRIYMLLALKRSDSDWFSKSELVTHISELEDTHLFSYICGGKVWKDVK